MDRSTSLKYLFPLVKERVCPSVVTIVPISLDPYAFFCRRLIFSKSTPLGKCQANIADVQGPHCLQRLSTDNTSRQRTRRPPLVKCINSSQCDNCTYCFYLI